MVRNELLHGEDCKVPFIAIYSGSEAQFKLNNYTYFAGAMRLVLLVILLFCLTRIASAQLSPDENQLGGWYMYFYQKKLSTSQVGVQGDFQYRAWNATNDLEQLLLRSGLTFRPKSNDILFTLGYAFASTGNYGDSRDAFIENRLYQEALFNQKIGKRFYLVHRWRFEQRFVEGQDFRTRFRYNIFINVPLNQDEIVQGATYLALYNELFMNGETAIGEGRTVEVFDRNRTYFGLGYSLSDVLRFQLGTMRQSTPAWSKWQLQLSVHHNF